MELKQYLIIGAGPSGLQMAYLMERKGLDYVVLESKDSAGAFFQKQPRHRMLLSLNKRFNGFSEREFNMRHDWNSLLTDNPEDPVFSSYSSDLYPHADDLCRYFEDFAARHRLNIRYNQKVTNVSRTANRDFVLQTEQGESYSCKRLICGTGAAAPYLPKDIEGIELASGYEDHDLHPGSYENQTVLVIGRGNSAFEVANHLAGSASIIHIAIGNRPIELAWETHSVRNLRAVNNTVVEMLHVKALHGAVGLNVRKISKAEGGGFDVVADEEVPNWREPGMLELKLHYDHVIRCTGFCYTTPEIFSPEVTPESCAKSKYPILDSSWQSTVPDLFYIGTAMAERDKKAASSFIHGFRYNVRTLLAILLERYHGKELPAEHHALSTTEDLRDLAKGLLTRLSTTAALYQQYGFFCDVLRFSDGKCEIIRELPTAYAIEKLSSGAKLVLVTFEYGFHRYPKGTNPLSFITQMDEKTSRRCAAYLHPVFRYYNDGELVFEDNLGESLTLRFGKHRQLKPASSPESSVDVELNTLMNIINRVSETTDEVFAEEVLLKNHSFRPWPKDRPLRTEGLPICQAEGLADR